MRLRNQAIMRFVLSVAAFGALCATGRALGGGTSSPAVGGQSSTAAVKTNGCSQFDSQHVCHAGEIIERAAEAKAILEGGRYTPDGSGPAVYVWMSQTCPFSKAFLRDRARFDGVQFRYFPVYILRDNQAQYVQVLMSRSLPDFLSYMDQTLRVPPARNDPARDQALNDLSYRTIRLQEIMAENGLLDHITTPSWFFIDGEKVRWARGYTGPETIPSIVAYLKSSTAKSQESVGSAAAGEITADAAEVKTLLEGGRHTADGSGPALYAFVSQTSSASKEFLKDRAQFSGVQFRYFPMLLTTDNSDQAVQAIESRSVPDFLSFMNQTLRAPSYRQDNARIDLFNDVARKNQRLNTILTQSDGVSLFSLSPRWFWFADGKVYWTFGYTPEYMAEIVASVRSSSSGGRPVVEKGT